MTANELAQRLEARKSGGGWIARCPAHADATPSLSIKEGDDGRVLLNCFAGCELRELTQAINIKTRDLFDYNVNEDQFRALAKGTFNATEKGGSRDDEATQPQTRLNVPVVTSAPSATLEPLSKKEIEGLAKWRGYSQELVEWLNSSGQIGSYEGNVAFPVQHGVHFRKEDGSWRYSNGAKPTLFVLGEIEEGAHVHVFESQWDAIAFADASGERSNIVATRGAGNTKLAVDKLRGHSGVLYLWPQNDAPGEKWAQDIARELDDQQLKLVTIPLSADPLRFYKDLNDWRLRGHASNDDVFNAFRNAQDFPVEETTAVTEKQDAVARKAASLSSDGENNSVPLAAEPPTSSTPELAPANVGAHGTAGAGGDARKNAPLALSFPSLADEYADGAPAAPSGPSLKSLPSLDAASGGLFGLWVLMGEPGVGKSALARQLACSASKHYPVILDYDYENGRGVIAHRLQAKLGDHWRYATRNWYVRDSISTLDKDLAEVGSARAMVIIDSLQSLPSSVEFQAESMQKYIRKLEAMATAGHFVLIISEKNRASYGHAGVSAGKGTGAIEYKAWFGINMIGEANDDSASPIECHVFKNRHRQKRGRVCWLERDASGFWFKEWSKSDE